MASLATSASAATWVHFFDCGTGARVRHYSFDPASVRKRGDLSLVSIKGDYSGVAGSRAAEVRLVWAVNCRKQTFYEKSRIEYDAAAKIVARNNSRTAIMDISPPGIAKHLSDEVCTAST